MHFELKILCCKLIGLQKMCFDKFCKDHLSESETEKPENVSCRMGFASASKMKIQPVCQMNDMPVQQQPLLVATDPELYPLHTNHSQKTQIVAIKTSLCIGLNCTPTDTYNTMACKAIWD